MTGGPSPNTPLLRGNLHGHRHRQLKLQGAFERLTEVMELGWKASKRYLTKNEVLAR
jgi:hypothetical protein